MVSKCANPECRVPFLYFNEGKLIALTRRSASLTREHVEFFWLCGTCSNDVGVEGILAQSRRLRPKLKLVCLSDYQH